MLTRSDLKPRPKQRIPCFRPVYLRWGQINPDLVFCVNTTQQITDLHHACSGMSKL